MIDGLWEGRFSQRRRESLWAVEQAVVIDVVSPAILFTFSPLLYCIFSNFFLCTQWAEAHSRRSVTHSDESENMLMHTWTHALDSQPTCAETFE